MGTLAPPFLRLLLVGGLLILPRPFARPPSVPQLQNRRSTLPWT